MKRLKLNSKQLRRQLPPKDFLPGDFYRTPVVLVLDNIQDTYNIGSFFRLADALGIGKIYLGGRTVTPPNPKIHRASVGLWQWVEWEHYLDTLKLVKELKKKGYFIAAIEQSSTSIPYRKFKPRFPLALILGHETQGVNPKVLKIADAVVEIPLFGVNRSLNVLVAASVVGYQVVSFWQERKKVGDS
ncbi:TrmH family RNA methyltransferase [bacterium]|nr:TrmH family RNA methyltransferase [bacterium]